MTPTSPVWILAGPTASGKSALALKIAQKINGVIINADSMQIYHEIPLLSAQPSLEDQAIAPHRLYGFQPIAQNFSSVEWAQHAVTTINKTFHDGQQPILVGGSGLYLRALIEGFSPMPSIPAAVRKHVTDLYDILGPNSFHSMLHKIDPLTAERLHPTDRQRCIRAREVYEVSGEPLSAWQARDKQSPAGNLTFRTCIVLPDREKLHAHINTRFVAMVDQGALDEARGVKAMNLPSDLTGAQALGLNALMEYLDGQISLNDAIELAQTQTRQYAKRQYTWFRRQSLPDRFYAQADPMTWFDDCLAHFTR